MDTINIIEATQNDVETLQQISRQTFYDTFSRDNTRENMSKYLEEEFSYEKLSAELADPNMQFYFAILGGKAIGYLKLNFGKAQTELKDENGVEIERIYVLGKYHGKKVGQLLFEKAIEVALRLKAPYVWLGVWEKNLRALAFYKKNGFIEFDKHLFKLGDDEQTDIMMKMYLKE